MDSNKAIMVVDDEDDLLQLASAIFERKGYRVLVADSGQKAIKVFRRNRPDIGLVILDIILPSMDGQKVYEVLKRSQTKPKIILTSGYTLGSPALKFLEECDDAFMPKPWDMPQLLTQVHQVMHKNCP